MSPNRSLQSVSVSALQGHLSKVKVSRGTSGIRRAYAHYLKAGELPKKQADADRVLDVVAAAQAMSSLELDYEKPGEDDDWDAILDEQRELYPKNLTRRWYPLFEHEIQHALWTEDARFKICPSGRRSGKTERAKRKLAAESMAFSRFSDGLFIAAAPTRDQAKEIFWEDLKELVPARFVVKVSESDLWIKLVNGARIRVVGLDKPQRVEGRPIDGIIVDEFGDTKPNVWEKNILPALNTIGREGWAWIFGVPRGARHYKKLYQAAQLGTDPEYRGYSWFSAEILPPQMIARIKSKTDIMTWLAEWEASFETTAERIYYSFSKDLHCSEVQYDPMLPLIVCLDFNTAPGIAVYCQEQKHDGKARTDLAKQFTAVIGEEWIEVNSTTPAVCKRIAARFRNHKGRVVFYGDASGGNKTSSSVKGSDWDLVKAAMAPVFGPRVSYRVRKANPAIVSRTAAVNSRLLTTDGKVHMQVNPIECPHLVIDLEDVRPKEGTREIDKSNKELTHTCFAAGTLVDTGSGMVPIEKMSPEGVVRTYDWSVVPYNLGGFRGHSDLVRVALASGDSIDCTPDHKFLTTHGDWVEARELSGKDVHTWMSVSPTIGFARVLTELVRAGAAPESTSKARAYRAGCKSGRAPISVVSVRPLAPADVFCITVPSTGCFVLANGMIVSNSDALGYYAEREFSVAKRKTGQRPLRI